MTARGYAEAVAHFDEALALWRDRPLAEMSSMRFPQPEIARLEELRSTRSRVGSRHNVGRTEGIAGEFDALVARPRREKA